MPDNDPDRLGLSILGCIGQECPVCGAPIMHPMQAIVVVDREANTWTGHPCALAWAMGRMFDRACAAVVAQAQAEQVEAEASTFAADLTGVEGVEDLLGA